MSSSCGEQVSLDTTPLLRGSASDDDAVFLSARCSEANNDIQDNTPTHPFENSKSKALSSEELLHVAGGEDDSSTIMCASSPPSSRLSSLGLFLSSTASPPSDSPCRRTVVEDGLASPPMPSPFFSGTGAASIGEEHSSFVGLARGGSSTTASAPRRRSVVEDGRAPQAPACPTDIPAWSATTITTPRRRSVVEEGLAPPAPPPPPF